MQTILNHKIKYSDLAPIHIDKNTTIIVLAHNIQVIQFRVKSIKQFRKKIRRLFGKKDVFAKVEQWWLLNFPPEGMIETPDIVAISVAKAYFK